MIVTDVFIVSPCGALGVFGLFDVIDEHRWVGSALTSAPGLSPIVRILERIGRQIRALGVPDEQQWSAVGALMAYILGVSRQNAANGQLARTRGLDRSDFLEAVSIAWSQLDPKEYPFACSVAGQIREHDDRVDFLAGIDLILKGIDSPRHRSGSQPKCSAAAGGNVGPEKRAPVDNQSVGKG